MQDRLSDLAERAGAYHSGGTVRDSHPASLNRCLTLVLESIQFPELSSQKGRELSISDALRTVKTVR